MQCYINELGNKLYSIRHSNVENAICCIDNVMTTIKSFQGRSTSIANMMSAQVCARGRDWLESVALLLSVSERDRVDVMALGGAKISIM